MAITWWCTVPSAAWRLPHFSLTLQLWAIFTLPRLMIKLLPKTVYTVRSQSSPKCRHWAWEEGGAERGGVGTRSLLNCWASLFLGRRHSEGGPPWVTWSGSRLTAQMFVLYVQNVSPIKCPVSFSARCEGFSGSSRQGVEVTTIWLAGCFPWLITHNA